MIMYKAWKDWLALNSDEVTTTVLVVVCLAFLVMLMHWSL